MNWVYYIIPFAAYFAGGFPTGVVLSRSKYGIDVREMGSGNIGATNVTRNFGWWAGVLTFLVDFLKGLAPLAALRHWLPEEPWLVTATGTALVLGHCFSPYLGFRGGKGVATSLGCLLAVQPQAAYLGAAIYIACLVVTRISAVGSLAGILLATIFVLERGSSAPVRVLVLAVAGVVVVRHRSNMVRLWEGLRVRVARRREVK
jgi:glycerol-3-phosphate acyltransferase PlsY